MKDEFCLIKVSSTGNYFQFAGCNFERSMNVGWTSSIEAHLKIPEWMVSSEAVASQMLITFGSQKREGGPVA